jgi:hypothetical protein
MSTKTGSFPTRYRNSRANSSATPAFGFATRGRDSELGCRPGREHSRRFPLPGIRRRNTVSSPGRAIREVAIDLRRRPTVNSQTRARSTCFIICTPAPLRGASHSLPALDTVFVDLSAFTGSISLSIMWVDHLPPGGGFIFITGRRDKELATTVKETGRNVAGVRGV